MKYLIVGTGRCGTGYMSKLFNKAGIRCGHENVFTPAGPKNFNKYTADSSWLAVPFIAKYNNDLELLIHIVRNPLKVFRSWLYDQNNVISLDPSNVTGVYNDYILKYFPRINEQATQVDKAAVYYIDCNRTIENVCANLEIPYLFFRVEDSPEKLLAEVNGSFGFNHKKYNTYNTKKTGKGTVDDVLPLIKQSKYYEELKDMFLRYYPELSGVL